MKKLILSLMLVAFAVAVQAGEGQCPNGGCCGKKAEKKETVSSPKGGEQAKR